jgi:hypothetical protein
MSGGRPQSSMPAEGEDSPRRRREACPVRVDDRQGRAAELRAFHLREDDLRPVWRPRWLNGATLTLTEGGQRRQAGAIWPNRVEVRRPSGHVSPRPCREREQISRRTPIRVGRRHRPLGQLMGLWRRGAQVDHGDRGPGLGVLQSSGRPGRKLHDQRPAIGGPPGQIELSGASRPRQRSGCPGDQVDRIDARPVDLGVDDVPGRVSDGSPVRGPCRMLGVIAWVLAVEHPGGIRLAGIPDPKVERVIAVGIGDGKGDLLAIGRPVRIGLHRTRYQGDLWRREEVA